MSRLDFASVSRVARYPTPLLLVEVDQERKSPTYGPLPLGQVDRLSEFSNRFLSEILFPSFRENVRGVKWTTSAVVVDNIAPDL
jgi:hypothetical protein